MARYVIGIFVALIVIFPPANIVAAGPDENALNFFKLSRINGLSNNNVTSVVSDGSGYLWFGTENGLNRYNGYEFVNYYHDPGDPGSIPGNFILRLVTDKDGDLWIGCLSAGLAMYDPVNRNFQNLQLPGAMENPDVMQLRDLTVSATNDIWVTTAAGVFRRQKATGIFSTIPQDKNFFISGNYMMSRGLATTSVDAVRLAADQKGGIWVVYEDWSLTHLDVENNNSVHINDLKELKSSPASRVNDLVYHQGTLYFATDNQGVIFFKTGCREGGKLLDDNIINTATSIAIEGNTMWITAWNGLLRYDLNTDSYHHYETDPAQPKSLTSGSTKAVYVDESGILWIGASNAGINYAPVNLPFRHVNESEEDESLLYHPGVSALLSDSRGNLWVAFQSGVLQVYRDGKTEREMVPAEQLVPGAGIGHIFKIFESSDGTIYISSWQGGVQRYDEDKGVFVNLFGDYKIFMELFGGLDIRDITESPDGELWFAVFRHGVARYNPQTGETFVFRADGEPGSLIGPYVYDVAFDNENNLWVSTVDGLCRLAAGESVFNYYPASKEQLALPDDHIRFSFTDSNGRMWFASNGGVSLYDPVQDGFFTIHNSYFGFGDLLIHSMEEDREGVFWLSTSRGIIRMEYSIVCGEGISLDNFYIFDVNHGILSDDFFRRSSAIDPSGTLFFGGNMGIDFFRTEAIRGFSPLTALQIEELRIFEKVVLPGTASGPPVNDHNQVVLNHTQNMITLTYSRLNFIESGRNTYFYRLEPMHGDWIYAGIDRSVTFTNLPPGRYRFRVRSCLGSVLCEGDDALFEFIITPPFWKTLPFRLGFIIIACLLILGIFRLWSARIRKKKNELEMLVGIRTRELEEKNLELTEKSENLASANALIIDRTSELEEVSANLESQAIMLKKANQQLSSLNSMKDKFFSIIAHDLKGPIATFSGFSDLMLRSYDRYNDVRRKEIIVMMKESAEKTRIMLDNLLQWANSQSDRFEVRPEMLQLHTVIENVYLLNQGLFKDKEIGFINDISVGCTIYGDSEMVRLVFRNLLSNAAKFTPRGGAVKVKSQSVDQDWVRVDVTDTGTGINMSLAGSLFQIDSTQSTAGTEGEKGSGLGLILCHEFVTRLGGRIWVADTSENGSTISVLLAKNPKL